MSTFRCLWAEKTSKNCLKLVHFTNYNFGTVFGRFLSSKTSKCTHSFCIQSGFSARLDRVPTWLGCEKKNFATFLWIWPFFSFWRDLKYIVSGSETLHSGFYMYLTPEKLAGRMIPHKKSFWAPLSTILSILHSPSHSIPSHVVLTILSFLAILLS